MSINALTSKDTDKGWANLYVNTLTAYNGIFGEFKGSSDVSGQTTFKDDVLFEEDVIMEESLKMVTGDIVSADGENHPWFVRQRDVQNGDGGTNPTGLLVSDTNQSGYKQFKTFESADGGYAHYGGDDNRIITYHTASDIIDEGVNEEGLVAKSATHGITARGLEPQDFHVSNLLQNPGVLQSVAVNGRHELRVASVLLADIETPDTVNDGDIIVYNSGTGQLQYQAPASGVSYPGHSLEYSRRPATYVSNERTDIYLGGLVSENLNYPEPFYGVVSDPTCRFRIWNGAQEQEATSSIFSTSSSPPSYIYYTIDNTINPSPNDRFLVRVDMFVEGATNPYTFVVENLTQGKWWMNPTHNDLTGYNRQLSLQGVFGNNERIRMTAQLQVPVNNSSDALRILSVDTHITKIA